jgi:hypothetical protein
MIPDERIGHGGSMYSSSETTTNYQVTSYTRGDLCGVKQSLN